MGRAEVAVRGVNEDAVSRGIFVTLEGGEAVGKSTQAARLADALRASGKSVVVTREPGGTPGAEAVRALLMTGDADRWSARAEALLFAAARADHVERVIEPALSRGDWVICDRFIDSTRAYQGGAGGLADDEIMALHAVGSRGLMPDRTLLLVLPTDEAAIRAAERDGGRPDRFGARDADYHARLAKAFEALAVKEADRIRVVAADGSAEDVTQALMAQLSDLS
jgi:dTMP kinase